MNPEDLLKALAEHDRGREAPGDVETRVLHGFRRRRQRRMVLRGAWVLSAAAALIAGFLIERDTGVQRVPVPQQVVNPQVKQTSPALVAAEPEVVGAVPARRVEQVSLTRPREIATGFFPLMDVALPFERGELLRVTLPASAMRAVGLPVNEDRLNERIQADVLVGEEGLARAIRFVRYEQ